MRLPGGVLPILLQPYVPPALFLGLRCFQIPSGCTAWLIQALIIYMVLKSGPIDSVF